MGFESNARIRTDLEFVAVTGQAKTEMGSLRRVYAETTGAMSEGALRAAVAQEKLDRAIARHGPESLSAKQATLAYRREMDALATSSMHTGTAVGRTEREIERMGRGAVAGTGILRGFGRAAAFASGYFLGGAGLVFAIRKTLEATKEETLALAQAGNAVHDAGLPWDQYRSRVEAATTSLETSTLFHQHELIDAFATVVRRTGDVGKALGLVSDAANLARASHIGLEQSVRILLRAQNGQTAGLSRAGYAIVKVTENTDALRASGEKYTAQQLRDAQAADKRASAEATLDRVRRQSAGAAKTYADSQANAQEKLNIELDHSERIIGARLLPIEARLAGEAANYLEKLNRTGQLQRDVNRAFDAGTQVAHGLRDAYHAIEPPLAALVQGVGGLKNAVEILIGLKVASWAAGMGGGFRTAEAAAGEGGLLGTVAKLRAAAAVPIVFSVVIDALLLQHRKQLEDSGDHDSANPIRRANDRIIGALFGKGVEKYVQKHFEGGPPGGTPAPAGAEPPRGAVAGAVSRLTGRGLQLPGGGYVSAHETHQTANLPGFPALDVFASAGTQVLAPEGGTIVRLSGSPPSGSATPGGAYGLSVYLLGDSGATYFMTHFATVAVRPGQKVRSGQLLGTVADFAAATGGRTPSHIHEGVHAGAAAPKTAGGPTRGGTGGGGTSKIGLSAGLQQSEYQARRSGTGLLPVLRAEDAYLLGLLKQHGLTPADKQQIEQTELGVYDEIQSILDAARRKAATGADKKKREAAKAEKEAGLFRDYPVVERDRQVTAAVAERKKQAAAVAKAQQALIDQLGGPSIESQIAEAKLENRRIHGQNVDAEEIKLLERERAAERKKLALTLAKVKDAHGRKQAELDAQREINRIDEQIAGLKAQAAGPTQEQIGREAAAEIARSFGSTVVTPGLAPSRGPINITQHFAAPPPDPHPHAAALKHELQAMGA